MDKGRTMSKTITNFSLKIFMFCFVVAACWLGGCQETVLVPTPTVAPTATLLPPTMIPTAEIAITHPELKPINLFNTDRIKELDQWGQGSVNGVTLSPDGSLIAVSTTTGIYLYDRTTAKETDYIDVRIGNNIEIGACPTTGNIAFSPDGSILAIASTDIKLWDLKTGTVLKVIENKIGDPVSLITQIQFSLDGNRIFGIQKPASGYPCYSGWGSLVIYRADTGTVIFRNDYSRYEEGPQPMFYEKNGIVYITHTRTSKKGYFVQKVDLQSGIVREEKSSPEIFSMNDAAALNFQWVSQGNNGEGYSQTHVMDLNSFEDIEVVRGDVMLIPHSNKIMTMSRENQELSVRTINGANTCSRSLNTSLSQLFFPEEFSSDGAIGVSWNSYGFRAGDIRVWDLNKCMVSISSPIIG